MKIKAAREIYQKAARYFQFILQLDQGDELARKLIAELKGSEHGRKRALLEEINRFCKIRLDISRLNLI